MGESLKTESERLARSWLRHDSAWLRDYLVSGVEDPRINLQSIFTRHFLIRAFSGEQFRDLMEHEYRFGAIMNWLNRLARDASEAEEFEIVLGALRRRLDNAEGIAIPRFVLQAFGSLPLALDGRTIPNYIESFLKGTKLVERKPRPDLASLEAFYRLWSETLNTPGRDSPDPKSKANSSRLSVLEPGCGSANDYRFLHAFGIARFLDYVGFDLCSKNVENARDLFPGIRFDLGNIFEIAANDNQFDYSFVHDLFEHLSPEGLNVAIRELCRVTRFGICANFFNMDEMPEHSIQPVEEYYWNKLSLARVKELFLEDGFNGQVVHVGTFLRQHVGYAESHNPNAYTFFLWRESQ
jgi:SAM-dependent methyltransferase